MGSRGDPDVRTTVPNEKIRIILRLVEIEESHGH